MQAWKLQDAKARFSEMVNRAQYQPQQITRHGKPVGVLVSVEEFATLQARSPKPQLKADGTPYTFIDHLLDFPDVPDDFFQPSEIKLRDIDV